MNRKRYALLAVLLACYIVGVAVFAARRPPQADRIDADNPALVAWGRTVYASYCAACHGARLEGQPDWRRAGPNGRLPAPPHDESGHTWHHADRELIRVVRRGLVAGEDRPSDYQGDMPAFERVLSSEEIVAVLSFIKNSWSYDYRAWQENANAGARPRAAASQ